MREGDIEKREERQTECFVKFSIRFVIIVLALHKAVNTVGVWEKSGKKISKIYT